MIRKLAILGALTLLLAACAAPQIPIVAVPPSTRTIAVVPSIPPNFRVATTGITAFENALDIVDITDWHLDDVAFEAAASVLSPRYQVVRVDADVVDADTKLDQMLNGSSSLEKQAGKFIRKDSPADLYLVISLSNTAQPYRELHNVYVGVGISKMRDLFVIRDPSVHTYLMVTVLDGKTGKTLVTTPLQKPSGQTASPFQDSSEPKETVEGIAWKDYWHEWDAGQQDLVRDRTRALLAQAVVNTVRQLRIVP